MSEYFYLVSSLPLLDLEKAPFLDSREFMDSCEEFLKDNQIEELSSLSLIPSETEASVSVLNEWTSWETKLRNTILQYRNKADIENPERFQREEDDYFSEIDDGVQIAISKNPLEREIFLDSIRWNKLQDLELGHDFDFARLCLYKIQLMLCEKRLDRNKERGSLNYDSVVEEIYGVDPLAPPQIEEKTGDT